MYLPDLPEEKRREKFYDKLSSVIHKLLDSDVCNGIAWIIFYCNDRKLCLNAAVIRRLNAIQTTSFLYQDHTELELVKLES